VDSTSEYLRSRADAGEPVRVGLIGAGQMGSGIAAQSRLVPGLELCAVADIDVDRASAALAGANGTPPVASEDLDVLRTAVGEQRQVVTRDARLLPALDLDVVVEATGVPRVATEVAFAAAIAGRNLVTMTVEADVTIGRLLRLLFERSGAVYTLAAGDEPSAAWELVDFARTMGLEVVAAGKGKNNPLRPTAVAADLVDEARRKHMNPKMLTAFVDGSKTMCEMALLANATGLEIDTPGMHGARVDRAELADKIRPAADGGILSAPGRVEYVEGDLAPGVFVTVACEDPTVSQDLAYLGIGSGPYWSLVRPYHLCNLEVPITIARLVRDGRATLQSRFHTAEVVARAKTDLAAGAEITGIGGDEVHGFTVSATQAAEGGYVPLGLLERARLVRPVAAGAIVCDADVELDEDQLIVRAWRLQEGLDGLGAEHSDLLALAVA
jgi:predicted homoserine dehydrogenase-like protein